MKRKIFTLLMLVAILLVGCGTATNNDVPANGITEAPSVTEPAATPEPTSTPTPEPTATPVPTSTPTPEPTATPEPTSTPTPEPTATPEPTSTPTPEPTATPEPTVAPTEAPKPTEAPVVSKANWKDFEVTLGGYTVKLRETTLGELLDTGLIEIHEEENVLARELDCGVGNQIEPCDSVIENFNVANYEANTVKSPADCVILNMGQDFWSDTEKLKLEICGIGVRDEATLDSLEAVFGKCSEYYKDPYDDSGSAWCTWYANGTDSEEGCIEIILSDYYGQVYSMNVYAPCGDITIYDYWAYYDEPDYY